MAPSDDLKPVRKFRDHKTAVARIWKAVTRLSPDVAQHAAHVASAKAKERKAPAKVKIRDTARTDVKLAREGSKKAAEEIAMRIEKGSLRRLHRCERRCFSQPVHSASTPAPAEYR